MMVGTKSRDRYTIFFAAFTALMMIGHLQGGKTVRDALFLSNFDIIDLPKIMIATAVFSAFAVVTFSRMLSRFGPARFTPALYIFSGIISVGEWAGMARWPHGVTIIVLPLGIIFGGLLTFVFRSLMTITLLRGAANLLTNSFFGPGYELLFTPISPADKRASKILIDVGVNRSGNMLGGLIIMGLLFLPGLTGSYILLMVMVMAGAMSLLIFLLNRGYISQLVNNLRSGTLKADQIEIKDKTTEGTVALT